MKTEHRKAKSIRRKIEATRRGMAELKNSDSRVSSLIVSCEEELTFFLEEIEETVVQEEKKEISTSGIGRKITGLLSLVLLVKEFTTEAISFIEQLFFRN